MQKWKMYGLAELGDTLPNSSKSEKIVQGNL